MRTLEILTANLGPPVALREIGGASRRIAAVGRWRHGGTSVDLREIDSVQVVVNVSGGQEVELTTASGVVRRTIVAGSLALVSRGDPASVRVRGAADVVHIAMSTGMLGGALGAATWTAAFANARTRLELRAAAMQALVALAGDPRELGPVLESIVRRIVRLLTATAASDDSGRGLPPPVRERLRSSIDARLESTAVPTLDELACLAGYSVDHFVRVFRRTEGLTPHAYLDARRIERATAMLLSGDARVDEIGEAVGYGSPSHFVSAYRKRVGVTPGALRTAVRR